MEKIQIIKITTLALSFDMWAFNGYITALYLSNAIAVNVNIEFDTIMTCIVGHM